MQTHRDHSLPSTCHNTSEKHPGIPPAGDMDDYKQRKLKRTLLRFPTSTYTKQRDHKKETGHKGRRIQITNTYIRGCYVVGVIFIVIVEPGSTQPHHR
ncbi:hypothetical protein BDZ45DRAFT_743695 [Acephala macrosclerotiorum]|nr:hypothetical protein BDZ45DRAFT_743695 [Acephala macrosclerotiorum]